MRDAVALALGLAVAGAAVMYSAPAPVLAPAPAPAPDLDDCAWATPPPPPDPGPPATVMDLTPDLKRTMQRLRDRVGADVGAPGAAAAVERTCRRFSAMAFRALSRTSGSSGSSGSRGALDGVTGDMWTLRAEMINAVQAMYLLANRERTRRELDAITQDLMRDTEAYIRAVRKTHRGKAHRRRAYEPGRGFPSPWWDAADPDYDLVV